MEWWLIIIMCTVFYWVGYLVGRRDGKDNAAEREIDTIQIINNIE